MLLQIECACELSWHLAKCRLQFHMSSMRLEMLKIKFPSSAKATDPQTFSMEDPGHWMSLNSIAKCFCCPQDIYVWGKYASGVCICSSEKSVFTLRHQGISECSFYQYVLVGWTSQEVQFRVYPVSEWTENCLPIGDMERRGETDCSRWVLGTPSKMEIQGCEPSQEACPCSFLAESPSPDLWSSCYHWTAAWFPRTSSWTFLMWAQPLPRVCKCVYSREILTFGFA